MGSLLSPEHQVEAAEEAPHAGVAAAAGADGVVLEGVGEAEVGVLALEVAAPLGERDEVLGIFHVVLILEVDLAYAGLVGVAGDGLVGDADGDPDGALLGALADHLHDPDLVGVGDGEALAGGGVAVLVHQVGHDVDGLAGGPGALQGDVDERAVVDDAPAGGVDELGQAAPGGLGDDELVLVHVAHHIISMCHFGDLAHVLAGIPVDDLAHGAGLVVGGGLVVEGAVEGVRVGGVGDHGGAVLGGLLAGYEVGAGVGPGGGEHGAQPQGRGQCEILRYHRVRLIFIISGTKVVHFGRMCKRRLHMSETLSTFAAVH